MEQERFGCLAREKSRLNAESAVYGISEPGISCKKRPGHYRPKHLLAVPYGHRHELRGAYVLYVPV